MILCRIRRRSEIAKSRALDCGSERAGINLLPKHATRFSFPALFRCVFKELSIIVVFVVAPVYAMESNARAYTASELADPELLVDGRSLELPGSDGKALFIGIYRKGRFEDIEEFLQFVANISSMTQLWYGTGNLDEAMEWYFPDEARVSLAGELEKGAGDAIDWLRARYPDVYLEPVAASLRGAFWVRGSDDAFQTVGESQDAYCEVFVADLME